ncbi:glutamate--tRNA ligase [Patescibacteria group bacterium]|nr:glutamate--tRNA ligase [Patescibacteria group bacterium]
MNKEITEKIITRLPPSPTGLFHIGTARTALFNYLFARQNNGQMLFRLEDTDKERSKKEFEVNIISGLEWLGLDYDGEITKQSERTEVYKKYLEKMIEGGLAYISEEEIKKEGQRGSVIRFKNPNKEVIFKDLIRGDVKFDTTELGDFVIAKSLEEPLYHLTVVVDDFEGEITHVIRGEDHISNTPRQILIQEAIGAERPIYAHLPLILSPDRSKMSKRHGATSVDDYKEKGYLPEAIINYLALMGWNPGTEEEIFTLSELLEKFDIKKVNKGGAIFNIEKLNWINKEHIKLMPEEDFKEKVLEFSSEELKEKFVKYPRVFEEILPIIKERIEKFEDVTKMCTDGEFDYYFFQPEYELEKIFWKDENDPFVLRLRMEKIIEILNSVGEFTAEKIKEALWDYATEEGRGSVLWPLRYLLSGRDKSPDPFTLSEILGKEETIKRINYAIEKIQKS